MAKKSEIKALEEKILNLEDQISRKDEEISKLYQQNKELINQVKDLQHLNDYLIDEKARYIRSDSINKELCMHLMHAITVLGKNESQRISNEVWHDCNSRQMQAMSIDNEKKGELDGTEI